LSALGGLATEAFAYKTEGSTLTVASSDEDAEVYEYSIDGDVLTLKTDDETVTLTKNK
jgi:hypothetical protein